MTNHATNAAERIDALQISQEGPIAIDQSEAIIREAIDAATAELTKELEVLKSSVEDWRLQPPLNASVEPTGISLVDRLLGIYTVPVKDGAGLLNGKDTFTRRFQVPAINGQAAQTILDLSSATAELRAENEALLRQWNELDLRNEQKHRLWQEENAELRAEVEELRKQLMIANKKNETSLANNLCPDHRDKQKGKPCLACEIERLTTHPERGV